MPLLLLQRSLFFFFEIEGKINPKQSEKKFQACFIAVMYLKFEICYSLLSNTYKPCVEWVSKKADSVDESDCLFMEISALLEFIYVFTNYSEEAKTKKGFKYRKQQFCWK